MTGPTDPRQPAGSTSMGGGGTQRPQRAPKRRGWVRDALPAILGLLLLVVLGIGALLIGDGGGDDPKKRTAAATVQTSTTETATTETESPATTAEEPEAEKPKPRKRQVRVRFRRLRGGLRGRGTVTVRRTRPGGGMMTVTARVPNSRFEVHLVRRRGPSKVLLTAIGGPATVTRRIPFSTFRRYRSIDVLARRLPERRGRGRVRSLRVPSARITRRLARTR